MIIIGILAAIAIPAFLSQREKARDTSTKADVSTVGKEIATYYVDGTGAVTVAVDTATNKATISAGSPGALIATLNTSKGTALLAQTAASTATTWCVAFTNPGGSSTKNWKYSALAGLESGTCPA
jgi:type II secretory pathway pseudopilin PulG